MVKGKGLILKERDSGAIMVPSTKLGSVWRAGGNSLTWELGDLLPSM